MATVTVKSLVATGGQYMATVDISNGAQSETRAHTFNKLTVASYMGIHNLSVEAALNKVLLEPYPTGSTLVTTAVTSSLKSVTGLVTNELAALQQILGGTASRSGGRSPIPERSQQRRKHLNPGMADGTRAVPASRVRRVVAGQQAVHGRPRRRNQQEP